MFLVLANYRGSLHLLGESYVFVDLDISFDQLIFFVYHTTLGLVLSRVLRLFALLLFLFALNSSSFGINGSIIIFI